MWKNVMYSCERPLNTARLLFHCVSVRGIKIRFWCPVYLYSILIVDQVVKQFSFDWFIHVDTLSTQS